MPDIQGNRYAHETSCKPGDIVIADGGFTCIPEGQKCKVRADKVGLYIMCQGDDTEEPVPGKPRHHRHYLVGQLNVAGEYVGLYHASEANFVPAKLLAVREAIPRRRKMQ
jgi:hypothetical protein